MTDALVDVIARQTIPYRKGDAVTERDDGGVHVVEVFGFPPVPPGHVTVDVHFIAVGFTEAAADRAGFVAALEAACCGQGAVTLNRLVRGLSYIELGAWLGDQTLALRLLALGEHHGVWKVLTPKRLFGFVGDDADRAAGAGYVLASGYNPHPVPTLPPCTP